MGESSSLISLRSELLVLEDRAPNLCIFWDNIGSGDGAVVQFDIGWGIENQVYSRLSDPSYFGRLRSLMAEAGKWLDKPDEAQPAERFLVFMLNNWRDLELYDDGDIGNAAGVAANGVSLLINHFNPVNGVKNSISSAHNDIATSEDFRSVNWRGEIFSFSTMQAACFKVLHRNWKNRTPVVSQVTILDEAGSAGDRLRDVFERGEHPAWNKLIISAEGNKGAYRLAAQSPSKTPAKPQ